MGNSAAGQAQHDIYGDLLETAWLYSEGHRPFDRDTGAVLGRIADHVCESGAARLRYLGSPQRTASFHAFEGDVLGRARSRARLAERGELPSRHAARWDRESAAIRDFVERECWSDALRSYTRSPEAATSMPAC